MMRTAHDTVTISTPVTDELYRELMKADVVTYLLIRPCVHERGNTINPGFEPHPRQPGSYRYHVLFGYSGVDESRTCHITERLQRFEAQVASEENEVWILRDCF
jgi:hypothetical protein